MAANDAGLPRRRSNPPPVLRRRARLQGDVADSTVLEDPPLMLRRLLALLGLTLAVSACTPAQFADWLDAVGLDSSTYSAGELEHGATMATAVWQQIIADAAAQAELHKYDYVLGDAQLARLRACESNGNYSILSPGGLYRGAYQFHQTTWNSVASRHFPQYVGVDPAQAPPEVQDAMARALFLEMGSSPWPVCGRYL